jgi:DNA-binding GntR family transcriptional regulator
MGPVSNRKRPGGSAVSIVREAIRERVSSGDHMSEVLGEEQLASWLGVSRTPVREALGQLVAEGLLVREPARGVRVFRPSLEDLTEIYEIRAPLEALAAGMAARRADDQFIQEVAQLFADLSEASPGLQYSARHEAFHVRISQGSGRRRLETLIRTLRAQSEPYIRLALQVDEVFRRNAQAQHGLILEAIRDRDGPRAQRLVSRHLSDTMTRVPQILSLGTRRTTEHSVGAGT